VQGQKWYKSKSCKTGDQQGSAPLPVLLLTQLLAALMELNADAASIFPWMHVNV